MMNEYYGIKFNPFDKNTLKEKDAFISEDHRQMCERLTYLKGIGSAGVFTASPGMGKTYALRCFMKSLNPNLNQMAYIPLTTVCVTEFYALICDALGIERSARKSRMFNALRDYIFDLYQKKRKPLILAIDEVQYLHPTILCDLKMLMNYEYDSRNCFTLILLGETHFNITLQKPVHEALRQRVAVHYEFRGLSDAESESYIFHKLECAGGSASMLDAGAVNAARSVAGGNPRKIDILMTHALTIGAQMDKMPIDAEVIRLASDNIALK